MFDNREAAPVFVAVSDAAGVCWLAEQADSLASTNAGWFSKKRRAESSQRRNHMALKSVALPAEFSVKLHERYEWIVCYKFHGNQDEEKQRY